MVEYDMHVATQGSEDPEFVEELKKIGLKDDGLIGRQVTFLNDRPVSSCPLIGVHMTKKYDSPDGIAYDMNRVKNLLEHFDQIGYAHAEVTSLDTTVLSRAELNTNVMWPFERFESEQSPENKKWDLHLSIPLDKLTNELEAVLRYEQSGLYHIDVLKQRSGSERRFRVYTIQGISSPRDGRIIHRAIDEWLREANVPHAEMKMETYIDMFRVGNPQIVPPTIKEIKYKS